MRLRVERVFALATAYSVQAGTYYKLGYGGANGSLLHLYGDSFSEPSYRRAVGESCLSCNADLKPKMSPLKYSH